MKISELIKQLEDMRLLYGDRVILTATDGESEYNIKSVSGVPCAKYFMPEDKVAGVFINIGRK